MTAPTIETERLRLRAHVPGDVAASYAIWSDPIVVRYISGTPSTRTQSWSRLLNYAGLWAMLGFGYWAVEERDGGRMIGEVGFADFKRDIDASMREIPEAGWVFAPGSHGRGYASEAMLAALRWADAHLASPRTVCMIDPGNAASMRVAEKAGFAAYASSTFGGTMVTFYERYAAKPR